LCTNAVLLLGAIAIFQRGIIPILSQTKKVFDIEESWSDQFIWILYQWLWLVPICILCYASSSIWYQSLANEIYSKRMKKKDPVKAVGDALYGTLVWAYLFLQVQLLTILFPLVLDHLVSGIGGILDKLLAESTSSTTSLFLDLLKTIAMHSITGLSYACHTLGFCLTACLYGWYGFDPLWIAANVSPDKRFTEIENHLPYFFGFGIPFTLLNKVSEIIFLSFIYDDVC
jgi:hypothetical protein